MINYSFKKRAAFWLAMAYYVCILKPMQWLMFVVRKNRLKRAIRKADNLTEQDGRRRFVVAINGKLHIFTKHALQDVANLCSDKTGRKVDKKKLYLYKTK